MGPQRHEKRVSFGGRGEGVLGGASYLDYIETTSIGKKRPLSLGA